MGDKWNKFKEKWGIPILASVIASILVAVFAGGIGYNSGKEEGKEAGKKAAEDDYYEELEKIRVSHEKRVIEEAKKMSCKEKYDKETEAARNEGILIGREQGIRDAQKNAKLECEKLLAQQKEDLEKAIEKQKEAEKRLSYYLEFFGMYKNNAEELVKMSKDLLINPNAAKQEELNSKLRAMISSVSIESEGAGIFQKVLNGELQECAKKLALKDAAAINHCLIILADTLPYKEKILTSGIYTMRERIPPEPTKP